MFWQVRPSLDFLKCSFMYLDLIDKIEACISPTLAYTIKAQSIRSVINENPKLFNFIILSHTDKSHSIRSLFNDSNIKSV